MVTRFGFSNLGPMALEGPGAEVFLGRDWFNQQPGYAESTGQAIDAKIRHLAKNALAQAIALLESRRELMDHLVEVLIAEKPSTVIGSARSQAPMKRLLLLLPLVVVAARMQIESLWFDQFAWTNVLLKRWLRCSRGWHCFRCSLHGLGRDSSRVKRCNNSGNA